MDYLKVKSTSKIILPKSKKLEMAILSTMKLVADVVGATLGPGGCPILIERQENLPEFVTKDGVTVFKNLGLANPIAHSIMSAARDAATRTASEAGDGTTTATVLAEAIVRYSNQFVNKNPQISAQHIVRTLEKAFKQKIEPFIKDNATQVGGYEEAKKLLHAVATISANGDNDIADAVMEAVDMVGEKGNATIVEISGPSKYEVECIEGFPVGKGLEDSCGRYFPAFITDKASQRCYLEKPVFLLYDGAISDIGAVADVLKMIGDNFDRHQDVAPRNVILIAHGFSSSVLESLTFNFSVPTTINVFPLITPQNMIQNSRTQFIYDISAFTGAQVFNVISKPLPTAKMADFGEGMEYFESFRFRSTIVGKPQELILRARVLELEGQLINPESQYEENILQERIGILTGGIARIKVYGASSGELREKRDRTEDAVCAVRGASEHGVLPGGGRTLLDLASLFFKNNRFFGKSLDKELDPDGILFNILVPSLEEPVRLILKNTGKADKEINKIIKTLYNEKWQVYDAMNMKFVDPMKAGILDSVPAVLEALRGSLSIASLLGTLGGCVVFPRDGILERQESKDVKSFLRDANSFDPNEMY